MNYNKKTILDVDVKGKKVLLRCDFNVPQDKETGAITSDKRIVAALPTIRYLLDNGAAVIACSHLGKPKGEWKAKLSLAPVAKRLSELLGQEVIFASDVVGEDAQAKAKALQGGQIMLLENLRFHIEEEKNDPAFAKKLADMAELYAALEAEFVARKGIYPNLDYPSGPAYNLIGYDTEMFTPLFVASRVTGWTAHIMEQLAANALIRPLSVYNGVPQRVVPAK